MYCQNSTVPTLTNTSTNLTIISSYLPCSNSSIEEYHHYLSALEQAIVSATSQGGYVIEGGDLNAHLGTLASSNGRGPSNDRGLLIKELIDKTYLYVVSNSCIATGSHYTYSSGPHFTTVDYECHSRSGNANNSLHYPR